MASILTNTSAMVALQTLKSTNKNMAGIQNQISTGMKIATAKDNASTWAIAQTMRSDVGGFKSIRDTLAFGEATVNVAAKASEAVSGLLNTIKEKIVESQSPSVDRAKIQDDIRALRDQINTIVGTAQFNGINLLNASENDSVSVLASLDRAPGGAVTASNLTVNRNDLRTEGFTEVEASSYLTVAEETDATNAEFGNLRITVEDANDTFRVGDVLRFSVGNATVSYTVTADDVQEDGNGDNDGAATAAAIRDSLVSALGGLGQGYAAADGATANEFVIQRPEGADEMVEGDLRMAAFQIAEGSRDVGGLAKLGIIDVSDLDGDGARAALADIEALVSTVTSAAASFGTNQKRIEIQSDFMGKLIDSMTTGIGAMVDADMEEASARLQALQVQQQLGIQSLSIANQNPQNILALFR